MFEKYIDTIYKREEELRDPIIDKTQKNPFLRDLVTDIYNYHLGIMNNTIGDEEDKEVTNKYMRQLLVKGVENNSDLVADFIYENAQELAVPLMTYASTRALLDVAETLYKKRNLKSKLESEERFDVITDTIMNYFNIKDIKDGDK